MLEDFLAGDYILTIERFYQTALIDYALTFGVAYTGIFEYTLVLIGESEALEYGGKGATSNLFLNLVEIFRV